MPKTIIDESIYKKAKDGLMRLQSEGTAANKLKAIMASYKHGSKKVSEIFDVDITSIRPLQITLIFPIISNNFFFFLANKR
jgi:hypothetical protein